MQSMSHASKVGRNDLCPCLSGKKFKQCCFGKVDWEALNRDDRDYRPYLSVRGRNMYFTTRICEALQLDDPGKIARPKDYKAAFTAEAVRKIYEATMEVWPPNTQIADVLRRDSGEVSGLYIGDYSPQYIARALVRHSIYASKILLVDPFIYPPSVRDEFNPILNPEQYRAQTLKNVNLWLDLFPWIEAGIVEIIRTPSDFDRKLNWDQLHEQMRKFEESESLKKASRDSVEELAQRHSHKFAEQQLLLGAPDSYLRHKFDELGLAKDGVTADEFLKSIQELRDRDRDFLKPIDQYSESQLLTITSGASYPSAKMTAEMTGSYLFTDIYVKWREIEIDRDNHSAENKVWAPFAKSVQDTPFRYLNNLRLQHALTLRNEGRLESLRQFLRRVWKEASKGNGNEFDEQNAILLAEELGQRVRDAELEWKQIDTDLLKIIGASALTELIAAGPLIAAGHANFLAAASVVAGTASIVNSTRRRRTFPERFPAAFFMKIDVED